MTLRVPDEEGRADLSAFVARVLRLDEAAVIRLRARADGNVVAWAATQFDVLACRAANGELTPGDTTVGADALARGLSSAGPDGLVETGFPMDSAWRGALPPENGFVHLDDVPARTLVDLAERGGELAREHGSAHGPPASLLDQSVVSVGSGEGSSVDVPMRCVFAVAAMGFIPTAAPETEPVRVRATASWLRLDARFGSVYRRRTDLTLLAR